MKQLSRLAAPTLSLVLLASCAAIPEEQKTNKKEEVPGVTSSVHG